MATFDELMAHRKGHEMTATNKTVVGDVVIAHAFHSCDYVEEVRLADCDAGCKVRRCAGCPREGAVHLDPCQGQRTLKAPSLASLHRKWLDSGLPAYTWAEVVRNGTYSL